MKSLIIIIIPVFCLCNAVDRTNRKSQDKVSSLQCYSCIDDFSIEENSYIVWSMPSIPSCSNPSKQECGRGNTFIGGTWGCSEETDRNGKRTHGCTNSEGEGDCKDHHLKKCKICRTNLCNKPEGYVDPDSKNGNKPGEHDGADGKKGNKTEGHDGADGKKDNNKEKTIQCYSCFDGDDPQHVFGKLPSCSTPSKIKCRSPSCSRGTTKFDSKKRHHGCDCPSDFTMCLSCEGELCNEPDENFGSKAKNGDKKGKSSAVTLKNNAIPLLSLFLILIFSCCLVNARI